jgi:putative DNA primase/helicase
MTGIAANPIIEGTKGTEGTPVDLCGPERFPEEDSSENSGNLLQPAEPEGDEPIEIDDSEINRPEFRTHNLEFNLDGKMYRPGLYQHTYAKSGGKSEPEPLEKWICTPIHAEAITANEQGESFGLLLRFINPNGQWQEWAAPMHLLKGSAEELRGELLNLGVRIDPSNRTLLTAWMMASYPDERIIAALCTGWHDDSFVLPQRTFGNKKIRFQSEHAAHNDFVALGTLDEWRADVASLCSGNPMLILAMSAGFTGPLLKRAKQQETGGAGIHLIGDSSQGKTTALQVAGSIWGPPRFVRTWRATSNGLEATSAALNDTLLILDEISECDPREIGAIVYALANGVGKQRAARTGGARPTARWRIIALSSGERSLTAHMAESGKRIKAGQEVRMLDIPATNRQHGLVDELHGHADGRALADSLKQATGNHYGYAGPAFVEALIADERDLYERYAKACHLPGLRGKDGIEGRAASIFALIGLAGELATEYGITGWHEGDAISAAMEAFSQWQEFRGLGQTEDRQILKSISDFIARNGDSRFSQLDGLDIPVRDRAGYWRDDSKGRVYLFHSSGLQDAAPGFDIRRILDAVDSAGWIIERDPGRRSKKVKVAGTATNLFWILPSEGDAS